MADESDDPIIDEAFFIRSSAHGVQWTLYDTGEPSFTGSLAETKAFVHGLWRGMAIYNPVELTCAIFDRNGTYIDMLVSKELLAA